MNQGMTTFAYIVVYGRGTSVKDAPAGFRTDAAYPPNELDEAERRAVSLTDADFVKDPDKRLWRSADRFVQVLTAKQKPRTL